MGSRQCRARRRRLRRAGAGQRGPLLWPAVGGAARMEPVDAGAVPLAEGAGQLLAEPQRPLVYLFTTRAALGAAAGGCFQPV
jgi:hypothetical protein